MTGKVSSMKHPAEQDFVSTPLGLIDGIRNNLTISKLIEKGFHKSLVLIGTWVSPKENEY